MKKRNDLGKFYQKHYKTGVGAEIGCLRGWFSMFLLTVYKGKILAIDSFDDHEEISYDKASLPVTRGEEIEKECRANMEGKNCDVIKGYSTEVAKTILDGSLDWVYIDADHRYEAVKADLEAWFPKVRKGGVMSGHDYMNFVSRSPSGDYVYGVKQAVKEFCKKYGYELDGLLDKNKFPSWYFIK